MKRGKMMKKLLLLVLLFSLLGSAGLENPLDDDGQAKMNPEVRTNHDPGDGGMGSWK